MKDENKALEARIITLGDSKVGKSSLIVQFIDNKFSFNYMSTVGFDLKRKVMKLNDNEDVKIVIHDIRFYETSAKEGNNVEKCFRELVELIVEKIHKRRLTNSNNKNKKLNKSNSTKKKNECCKG